MYRIISIALLAWGILIVSSAQEIDNLQAGDKRNDEQDVSQVYVPTGCFLMGTSDEEADYARTLDAPAWARNRLSSEQPQREVCITQAYWIDEFEVTNQSFQQFINADAYSTETYWSEDGWTWLNNQSLSTLSNRCLELGELDYPRVCLTWYEAEAYAAWRGGRLPTEAEWEFAARSPDSFIYPWGNEWDTTRANVEGSEELMPVGSYIDGVSWVGAHDMAGNTMEWVADWLAPNYNNLLDQIEDPTGPSTGRIRIEKGGWWGSSSLVSRSAYRHFEDPPTYQDHHIGFRIVTPIEDTE